MPSESFCAYFSGKFSRMKSVSMAPSTITWATCKFMGPNSRAMLWASARMPCLAPANAAKLAAPRKPAVAPVNKIVPRLRVTMRLATSRALRKPEKQAISHILKYFRAVSSRMLQGTFAPMLKTNTSTGPISDSIRSTSSITSSSLRASEAKP
ncbi:hypothetical protein D9M71_251950 [compost metagenome]